MSAPVMANESVSHGAETTPKPRPFGNRRVGHPEKRTGKPTPSLGVDVLEWYYRPHAFVKKKNGKRVRHPPFGERAMSNQDAQHTNPRIPNSAAGLDWTLVPRARRMSYTLLFTALLMIFEGSSATVLSSTTEIRVQVLNAKTGRPFSKIRVLMFTWNGNFEVHQKTPPLQTVDTVVGSDGWALFSLPRPMPEHMSFSIGDIGDFMGCWRFIDDSPETALRDGLIAQY